MTTDDDKQFVKNAKTALNQQLDSLDRQTLSQIRQATEAALRAQDKPTWLSIKWVTGAGAGLALAAVITLMIVPQLTSGKLSPLDDLDLLSAEADMDLYTQLDFYQWLDESLDES